MNHPAVTEEVFLPPHPFQRNCACVYKTNEHKLDQNIHALDLINIMWLGVMMYLGLGLEGLILLLRVGLFNPAKFKKKMNKLKINDVKV